MFGEILQVFAENRPVTVMVHGLLARISKAKQIEACFETVSDVQYTQKILFSSLHLATPNRCVGRTLPIALNLMALRLKLLVHLCRHRLKPPIHIVSVFTVTLVTRPV